MPADSPTTGDPVAAAMAYVGVETDWTVAADPVERSAVRRFAQASLDEDAAFMTHGAGNARFGGAVAPHLFPTGMFVRPFGTPDPIAEHARDPDFDGTGALSTQGLPEIAPLAGLSVLNGGSDIEFFSFARLGEAVKVRSRYADIFAKDTSKGRIVFVVIESDYATADGRPLVKVRRTQLRRQRSGA